MKQPFVLMMMLGLALRGYSQSPAKTAGVYRDRIFLQEYSEPYPVGATPEENNVRKIAVDAASTVWIATVRGVLRKKKEAKTWTPVSFSAEDQGPAYTVVMGDRSAVWMGMWNGIFLYQENALPKKIPGTEGPVSVICSAAEGLYAIGPKGVWLFAGDHLIRKNYPIARSVRNAVSDGQGGLWITSNVGLYHCNASGTRYFQDTSVLLSAYLRGLSFDARNRLWVAGLGGVNILRDGKREKVIRPAEGCPSIHANCVARSPENSMWIGTPAGVVRYAPDGTHSLLFSRRWLLDDEVNDIAFDRDGDAWLATAQGVSAIRRKKMTLRSKADYFYQVEMRRHIRSPWISGQCRLSSPGDTSSWRPEDDDNDGEYGGNYLAMESFRFAATHSEDARIKAGKAFAFLKQLREVTGGDGYFARTIVPADWPYPVHDANEKYTDRQIADELVKEPRYKPVETRWRKSADGQWLWKGDASSDEWCGHMMGYYFYYELVADDAEKRVVRQHVAALVDHLIAHDFNMMDVDGTATRWSVWSPKSLNGDPEWGPDRSENSMELLAFLKLAYYMTGDEKYQTQYLRFVHQEHYLDNMSRLLDQNPAWFIYYDVMMQSYLFPILICCEKDPALKAWYENYMDKWMKRRVGDRNPQINFFYCYTRNKKVELEASVDFFRDTPLDLVSWVVDQRKREDVHLVHSPVLDQLQVSQLPPASIRPTIRWDANPWDAVSGDPNVEREPVFWLLPYWMGRYLNMIQ